MLDSDCELLKRLMQDPMIERPNHEQSMLSEFDSLVEHVQKLAARRLVTMDPPRPVPEGEYPAKYRAVRAVVNPAGQEYVKERC